MKLKNEIDRTLKIGCSCYYMNISAFYEYANKLFLSLAYLNCDFIYNTKLFLTFDNPQEPEKYISPNNELIISGTIDSVYLEDIFQYIDDTSNKIYPASINKLCNNKDVDLNKIQDMFLSKDIPIIFSCDHYYMYSEYKEVTNNIVHFHTGYHMAILLDIDFNSKTAFIVDKFYSFIGTVKLSSFINSIESEYIVNGFFGTLNNYSELFNNEITFYDVFMKNMNNLNEYKYVTADGNTYYKNIRALEKFREDFKSIITSLQDAKGKYAPQFLSKLIAPTILQRISFNNFMKYYQNMFKNSEELLRITDESSKLWTKIDMYNDKTYLSNKTLKDNEQKYLTLLDKLISIDTLMYDKLNRIELLENK